MIDVTWWLPVTPACPYGWADCPTPGACSEMGCQRIEPAAAPCAPEEISQAQARAMRDAAKVVVAAIDGSPLPALLRAIDALRATLPAPDQDARA